jgi:hypothetical protein
MGRIRALVSWWLARFDAMVDGIGPYAPGSRVHENGEGGWRRD